MSGSARVRGLQRLADVYGMVEQMRSVELKVASAAVAEATVALEDQRTVRRVQAAYGRGALERDDRPERLMADSQAELAQARALRVEQLRAAREIARESALDAYRASRIRLEQMQQVVRTAREREAAVERRRFQAALDDRHLSRKIWTLGRARAIVEGSER